MTLAKRLGIGITGIIPLVALSSVASLVIMVGQAAAEACPNETFRIGASANLPDCRAYELVTPTNTGGQRPNAGSFGGMRDNAFDMSLASPDANELIYQFVAGSLSGQEGTGANDRYSVSRGSTGWVTRSIGPTGSQTSVPEPGGLDSQHGYSFLLAGYNADANGGADFGSLVDEFGYNSVFLRTPRGSFEILGKGSLGVDPTSSGLYISPGGSHILFSNRAAGADPRIQLEPNGPPTGTTTLYDRGPLGPTHVVSLLPGNVTPTADEGAIFEGASSDGTAVAFKLEGSPNLYVRVNNDVTYQVASIPTTFAGISADGDQVFYSNAETSEHQLQTPGDLFSFNLNDQTTTQITNVGDARFVNVPADGSRVYFESESSIGGSGATGAPNLYSWERAGAVTTFIGTVASTDISGAEFSEYPFPPSLAGWTKFVTTGVKNSQFGAAANLSRTTFDGHAIAFESSAQLTAYDNAGQREVYLYRSGSAGPICVSCGPGIGPATASASLQSISPNGGESGRPLEAIHPTASLNENGNAVIFESNQALVAGDANQHRDVYEWEDKGVHGCESAEGCIGLISGGKSSHNSYLYAVSADNANIFILTDQQLLPQDENGATGAIYDARVNGGFPLAQADQSVSCSGESCQGEPNTSPNLPANSTRTFTGKSNVKACRRKRHKSGNRKHKQRPRSCKARGSNASDR